MKMVFIEWSLIFLVSINLYQCESDYPNTEEYCISETFRPSCSSDELIIVDEATYGRKNLGKCLQNEGDELSESNMADRKFLGCYADVMSTLEPLCSLKKSCEVRVAEITTEVPCYKYLRYTLEVRYSCIRVIQDNRLCTVKIGAEIQHLLASKSSSSNCGSALQPWVVDTLPGQRITIKTLTFSHLNNNNNNNNNTKTMDVIFSNINHAAITQGYIVDKFSKKKLFMEVFQRELFKNDKSQDTFVSDSNNIEIYFHETARKDKISFILSIEATGCSDLIPPADAWLKRTENEATIGCYSTRLRWQLKCVGQRWIGVIGNCSQGQHLILKPETHSDNRAEASTNNQIVTIFLIVVSGLVLCMLITCIGVVFLKRYYAISKSKALKELSINGKSDKGQYVEGHLGTNLLNANGNLFYDTNKKNFFQNNKEVGDVNGIHYQDAAQYFELDGSVIDKESHLNVT